MIKIIPIRDTTMGARTYALAIDPTIKIEERWGRTHGEARISGSGRYLLVDISNKGNHRCCLIKREEDGTEFVLDRADGGKFCHLCDRYR